MDYDVNTENRMAEALDSATVNRKGFQVFNRLGFGLVLFALVQSLLPMGIRALVSAIAPQWVNNAFFGIPLVYLSMYLVGFPLMLLLLRGIPNRLPVYPNNQKQKLGIGTLLALYPISFTVLTLLAVAAGLIEHLIGKSGTVSAADLASSDVPQWVFFVAGVLIAPIMEEIIFRRLIYNKVAGYGAGVYILWSSLTFGLFHMNFGQSLYAGAMGVIFAVVMYKTGNVLYSIILHIMINLTGGIGIGTIVMRSGNETILAIYNYYVFALIIIGFILSIIFIIRKFFVIHAEKGEYTLPHKKVAFLNPGTVIFCLGCIGIIVAAFFQ